MPTHVDRLRTWAEAPTLGRTHPPYKNPSELKDDMIALLDQHEILDEGLRTVLDFTSGNTGPTLSLTARLGAIDFHAQSAIQESHKLTKEHECKHEFVDARNSVVLGGEVCLKCGAIRAGNEGS